MIKADNLVGQVIGNYQIFFELPSQNTQSLYLGKSEAEPGRQVTLKLVSNRPLSSQAEQESFLQEARMLQHLEHPYIMPILDYGLIHDLPYIVTPHTAWRPLSTYIRRHWSTQFALPKTLLLLSQLGKALHYAHQQHILHGQLSPRCVLLDDQQRPLLTDFCFTSLDSGATSPPVSNSESLFYLAPKQRTTGWYKEESDQYALACIAYELLTGRRPALSATNAEEDAAPPVAPSMLNPAVPPALDKAILKALSVDPEKRLGSLHEFLAALPSPQEIGTAPDPDATATISSVTPAQFKQETRQTLAQDVAASASFAPEHQNVQADAHSPLNAELQKTVLDLPIHQVQAPPFPIHPAHEQPPAIQPAWSFMSEAAPFQPHIPEPINPFRAPPPPPESPATFAPALPIAPAPFPMPDLQVRHRLPRMAQPLLIAVALLVVLGSGIVLAAALGRPTRSATTTAQATTRLTPINQPNIAATTQKAHYDAQAKAQAQIIATAQAQGKPQLLWAFTTGGPVWPPPKVVNEVVYVGSDDDNLYAIDAVTAQQEWTFATRGAILSSLAVVNGIIYTGSSDSRLYAIDAATGQQKWHFATKSGISASPAVSNGIVYISSGDGKLYAVDATTGQQKWTFAAKDAFWRSLIIANGVVYAGSIDQMLYAIDAASGQQKWTFRTASYITASPTVVNGVVYVGSMDRKLYAIDATTGQQKWDFVTGDAIWSSPTVVNSVVYVGSNDHKLYAIDATTGQQKWAFTTGDKVWSSPTVVNGVVYVGSMDHKLYAINATTGQQKWAFTTGDAIQYSSPTVVNGVVYIGSKDHKLYAIAIG